MIALLQLVNRLLKTLYIIAFGKCADPCEEARRGYEIGKQGLKKFYEEERNK